MLDLKPGDRVVVSSRRSGRYISKVARITPSGNIRCDNGELYEPTGSQKTSDVWNISHISKLTPEIEEEIMQENYINRTLAKLHKISNLTYDQCKRLNAILEEDKDNANN